MRIYSLVLLVVATLVSACSDSSSSGNVTIKGSGSLGSAQRVLGASDPSFLSVKIYKFAVSENADCSEPITVFESDAGVEADFLSAPTLGSGDLAAGTYPCVMFDMSDILTFKTTAADGPCEANTEYELEVCRADSASTGQLIDGTAVECADGEQRVGLFVSTNSSSTGGGEGSNAFAPPTSEGDDAHGINLGAALTISEGGIATFVIDGSGQVNAEGGDSESCDMQPPSFSFSFTES